MKLVVLQYHPYQFYQIKKFLESLGNILVVAKQTEEEKVEGSYKSTSYRIVNTSTGELSSNHLSQDELISLAEFEYLIYTGIPYKGLSQMAEKTSRGFAVCIGHSIIASRYDASLLMPTQDNVVGLLPECWTGFKAVKKEAESTPSGRFIKVKTAPIVSEVISTPPEVEVENKIGAIFGCLSAFNSYRKILKKLKMEVGAEKVKVKFHPLTDMSDPDVLEIINDEDFEILPTGYDKYKFTDSCKFLIGGCSSLLIEAYLRNLHFNSGQFISKFKERRGIDLNMPENCIDTSWTGVAPHASMIESFQDSNEVCIYLNELLDTLHLDYSGKVGSTSETVHECSEFLLEEN